MRSITATRLKVEEAAIADLCERHRIRRLALFGSYLKGEQRPDSDVDLLVEFEPGTPVGMFALVGIEMEFSDLFGRKVDLRTAPELSRYFRDDVVRTAEVLYERA